MQMQHYGAFYLGLHCLQNYSFRGADKPIIYYSAGSIGGPGGGGGGGGVTLEPPLRQNYLSSCRVFRKIRKN